MNNDHCAYGHPFVQWLTQSYIFLADEKDDRPILITEHEIIAEFKKLTSSQQQAIMGWGQYDAARYVKRMLRIHPAFKQKVQSGAGWKEEIEIKYSEANDNQKNDEERRVIIYEEPAPRIGMNIEHLMESTGGARRPIACQYNETNNDKQKDEGKSMFIICEESALNDKISTEFIRDVVGGEIFGGGRRPITFEEVYAMRPPLTSERTRKMQELTLRALFVGDDDQADMVHEEPEANDNQKKDEERRVYISEEPATDCWIETRIGDRKMLPRFRGPITCKYNEANNDKKKDQERRFILFEEPAPGGKLNTEYLMEITGGGRRPIACKYNEPKDDDEDENKAVVENVNDNRDDILIRMDID